MGGRCFSWLAQNCILVGYLCNCCAAQILSQIWVKWCIGCPSIVMPNWGQSLSLENETTFYLKFFGCCCSFWSLAVMAIMFVLVGEIRRGRVKKKMHIFWMSFKSMRCHRHNERREKVGTFEVVRNLQGNLFLLSSSWISFLPPDTAAERGASAEKESFDFPHWGWC